MRTKEVRSERVGACFTPSELKKIDEYCRKMHMSRSEFVSAATCIAVESDYVLKVVANMLVPTIRGCRAAIDSIRSKEPDFKF